jgi:hypothetical protein
MRPVPWEQKIVATGTWFYDGTVPRRVTIYARPARFSGSRFNDDDQLDESRPIPVTPDGLVYRCDLGGREAFTLDEAKAQFDAQPWGPAIWD